MKRLAVKVAVGVLAGCVGLIGAGFAVYELATTTNSHSTPNPAYSSAPAHAAGQTTPAP